MSDTVQSAVSKVRLACMQQQIVRLCMVRLLSCRRKDHCIDTHGKSWAITGFGRDTNSVFTSEEAPAESNIGRPLAQPQPAVAPACTALDPGTSHGISSPAQQLQLFGSAHGISAASRCATESAASRADDSSARQGGNLQLQQEWTAAPMNWSEGHTPRCRPHRSGKTARRARFEGAPARKRLHLHGSRNPTREMRRWPGQDCCFECLRRYPASTRGTHRCGAQRGHSNADQHDATIT